MEGTSDQSTQVSAVPPSDLVEVESKNPAQKLCYIAVGRKAQSRAGSEVQSPAERTTEGQGDEPLREPSLVFKAEKKRYYLKEPVPIIHDGRRKGYGRPKWTSTGTDDYEKAVAFMKAHARTPEELAIAPPPKSLTFGRLTVGFFKVSSPWTLQWKAKKGYIPRDLVDKESDLRLHIGPYFNRLRPDEFTPSMISAFVYDHLKGEKGLSSSSCHQILSTLRTILDYFIETSDGQILDSNPARARKMELEKDAAARDILTDEEFARHYDETLIEKNWVTPRHGGSEHADPRAMYTGSLLAATTTMRIAEVQGLQLQHVHLDDPSGPWIRVEWQWGRKERHLIPPKNKRERGRKNAQGKRIKTTKEDQRTVVGLTKAAAKWLRVVIAIQGVTEPEDLIFHNHDGTKRVPWGYRSFERWDHLALEKIGVDWKGRNIVFHSNRHFGATVADEEGGEEVGRSMTGHQSKVYYEYVHKRVQRQRPVIEKLDLMLNKGVRPEIGPNLWLVKSGPQPQPQSEAEIETELVELRKALEE